MTKRRQYNWACGERDVRLGDRTLVMGILNVTPDSFSDGGAYFDPAKAVARALEMVAQGADMIDIGGESTRPGSEPVPEAEEIRRVVRVVEEFRNQSDLLISVDTMKAAVAKAAIDAGANIINDVSAFEADPKMIEVAAASGAGVVLMHKKGSPKTMQDNPSYGDVVEEVKDYLKQRIDFAVSKGVDSRAIVVDPGIGFGKTLANNLALLRAIPFLVEGGYPLLLGASRKSFIGQLLDRECPEERLAGNLATAVWAAMGGAHILRVHDVLETCDASRLVDTLLDGEKR